MTLDFNIDKKTKEQLQKLNLEIPQSSIDKLRDYNKTNYHGIDVSLGNIKTAYSKFKIIAKVVDYHNNDIIDDNSSFDCKYTLFAEQYINDIQITKIVNNSTISNTSNISGKFWSMDNTSIHNKYSLVNIL